MISLDLFGEVKQNTITLQQRGELYMRIFRYMSEDFVNNQDMETFVIALISWIESVETRMQTLSQALMSHTHPITPHTHPVPPHTHSIPAHIHVAPPMGGPTSPMPVITDTGTLGMTNANAELPSGVPTEPSSLQWPQGTIPAKYINTSGAITNIASNKITPGSSVIGDYMVHPRRTLVVPEAAVPNIPPYLVPTPV